MCHGRWDATGIHLGSKGETLAVGAGLTGQPCKENKATNIEGFGKVFPINRIAAGKQITRLITAQSAHQRGDHCGRSNRTQVETGGRVRAIAIAPTFVGLAMLLWLVQYTTAFVDRHHSHHNRHRR
jgi:hypothetical protein